MNMAAWFLATNAGRRTERSRSRQAGRSHRATGRSGRRFSTPWRAALAEAGDFDKAAAIAKQAADAAEQVAAQEMGQGRRPRPRASYPPRPSACDCVFIEQRRPYRDTRIGVDARISTGR